MNKLHVALYVWLAIQAGLSIIFLLGDRKDDPLFPDPPLWFCIAVIALTPLCIVACWVAGKLRGR